MVVGFDSWMVSLVDSVMVSMTLVCVGLDLIDFLAVGLWVFECFEGSLGEV